MLDWDADYEIIAAKQRDGCIVDGENAGFTLIELMLVLVILATLAAIVTPKFTGQSQKAKITAARTQISQFEVALDAFEIDMGRYPTTAEGLRALVEKPASGFRRMAAAVPQAEAFRWIGGAASTTTGVPASTTRTAMTCTRFGPDGKLGGDDDITNWSEGN